MHGYRFTTADFALSDEGVHLLRSGYNYETIPFGAITSVSVKKGVAVRSPLLALAIALLLVGFALLQTYRVYAAFHDPTVYHISIESIVVVVLPLLVGFYMAYVALRREWLLVVATKGRTHKLPVRELRTKGTLEAAEAFPGAKLGTVVWA